jgi:hypothetical protein
MTLLLLRNRPQVCVYVLCNALHIHIGTIELHPAHRLFVVCFFDILSTFLLLLFLLPPLPRCCCRLVHC